MSAPARSKSSIKRVSEDTFILPEDIIMALKEMNVLSGKTRADGTVLVNQAAVRDWARMHGLDVVPVIDLDGFVEGVPRSSAED